MRTVPDRAALTSRAGCEGTPLSSSQAASQYKNRPLPEQPGRLVSIQIRLDAAVLCCDKKCLACHDGTT
eukprot:scaffold414775_cov46-Prasinocladus_malaysianus.AAC.1